MGKDKIEEIKSDMSWILAEIYEKGKTGSSIYYPTYEKEICQLFEPKPVMSRLLTDEERDALSDKWARETSGDVSSKLGNTYVQTLLKAQLAKVLKAGYKSPEEVQSIQEEYISIAYDKGKKAKCVGYVQLAKDTVIKTYAPEIRRLPLQDKLRRQAEISFKAGQLDQAALDQLNFDKERVEFWNKIAEAKQAGGK